MKRGEQGFENEPLFHTNKIKFRPIEGFKLNPKGREVKKLFVLVIVALSIFSAGCSTETKVKATVVDSGVQLTDEQVKKIADICELSDGEIYVKDTFTDYYCYSA